MNTECYYAIKSNKGDFVAFEWDGREQMYEVTVHSNIYLNLEGILFDSYQDVLTHLNSMNDSTWYIHPHDLVLDKIVELEFNYNYKEHEVGGL